ncbi:MAG TPA: FecR domain-containing protein [Polyangiaceae bacterium]|jgi:transmembrane sensor
MRRLKGFDPSVLSPPLDEERLTREYEIIHERTLRRASGRARWAPGLAMVAVACAVALLFAWRTRFGAPQVADGAVLVTGGSEEPMHVALPEGSRVEVGAHTRARLTRAQPDAIRIDVESGSVDVEATHVAGRTFVVGAGRYEVHVTGTHFHVERIPGRRVGVRVDEGVVEVASAGAMKRRLGAGEQWWAPDGQDVLEPTPSEGPDAEPDAAASPAISGSFASAPPAPPPPVASSATARDTKRDTANDLFQAAQRARAEGRAIDAAQAFDKVRRTYRKDPHAALAAFELGRLRLDVLGDPVGAEDALRDAVVLGPQSPLREDAEARRVEALSRAGDQAGCLAARDEYLEHWPNGTFKRTVELYCGK